MYHHGSVFFCSASMDKRDENWSKTKHGDDVMHKGIKNRVTSDDFRTLKPP